MRALPRPLDANSDGLSAPDELRTPDGWGIASISTEAFASTQVNNGNVLGLVSSYQKPMDKPTKRQTCGLALGWRMWCRALHA